MFDLLKPKDEGTVTFAEPGGSTSLSSGMARSPFLDPILHPEPYRDIFMAAERQTRLVDNVFAQQRATEEAYDQRIAAVKAATGMDLENPLRGGYRSDAAKRIRDEVRMGGMQPIDAKGGIPEYQARIFDEKFAELRQKYPDLPAADLKAEAQSLAKGADEAAGKATGADVNPITSLAFQVAGGMWAGRRDPLFVGSMFLGPTSAVGKSAITRVVTSGIFQGAYNAGVAAMEQPAVQAWRSEAGLRSGTEPALENVGLAFLFGMIPGAVLRGGQELIAKEAMAARPAIERVLTGHPEPGDAAIAVKAVGGGLEPHQQAAVHMGEEMQAADRATLPEKAPEVPPELHDDMTAAALKRADDPEAPSPEAVAIIHSYQDATSPALEDAFAKAAPFRDPLEVARRHAADPEGTHAAIQDAVDAVVAAEHEMAGRHGTTRRKLINGDFEDAGLTPRESDFLYYGDSPTSVEGLRGIEKQLEPVSSLNEASTELGYALGKLPKDPANLSSSDSLVVTRLQVLFSEIERLGGDVADTTKQAVQKYAAKFGDPEDAGFMVGDVMERLKRLMEYRAPEPVAQIAAPPLPAPNPEVAARIEAARPNNVAEAQQAADGALDDLGRRQGMVSLRERMDNEAAMRVADGEVDPWAVPPGSKPAVAGEPPVAAAKPPRGDPFGKVPFIDEQGRPKLLTDGAAAKLGEREANMAMLIRSCK